MLKKDELVVVNMGTVFDIFEEEDFASVEKMAKWTLVGSVLALGGLLTFFFR